MLAGAETKSDSDRGQTMIIAGLFIQFIFFGGFIVVGVVFHRRFHRNPIDASLKI